MGINGQTMVKWIQFGFIMCNILSACIRVWQARSVGFPGRPGFPTAIIIMVRTRRVVKNRTSFQTKAYHPEVLLHQIFPFGWHSPVCMSDHCIPASSHQSSIQSGKSILHQHMNQWYWYGHVNTACSIKLKGVSVSHM